MKRLKYAFILVAMMLMLPMAAVASPTRAVHPTASQSALSGDCYFDVDLPPYTDYSTVISEIILNCSHSHTRQVEVCQYSEQYNGTGEKNDACAVSGEYSGKSFSATSYSYGIPYYQSGFRYNVWYWMHDYATGETWQGWGQWTDIGIIPY